MCPALTGSLISETIRSLVTQLSPVFESRIDPLPGVALTFGSNFAPASRDHPSKLLKSAVNACARSVLPEISATVSEPDEKQPVKSAIAAVDNKNSFRIVVPSVCYDNYTLK